MYEKPPQPHHHNSLLCTRAENNAGREGKGVGDREQPMKSNITCFFHSINVPFGTGKRRSMRSAAAGEKKSSMTTCGYGCAALNSLARSARRVALEAQSPKTPAWTHAGTSQTTFITWRRGRQGRTSALVVSLGWRRRHGYTPTPLQDKARQQGAQENTGPPFPLRHHFSLRESKDDVLAFNIIKTGLSEVSSWTRPAFVVPCLKKENRFAGLSQRCKGEATACTLAHC